MLSTSQAQIKLDIDDGDPPDVDRIVKLCWRAGVKVEWMSQVSSPGGKGWHIVISVLPRPRTAMEVVALQAVLGGDPWREACQVQRARAFNAVPRWMRDRWNVLYVRSPARSRRLNLRRFASNDRRDEGVGTSGDG